MSSYIRQHISTSKKWSQICPNIGHILPEINTLAIIIYIYIFFFFFGGGGGGEGHIANLSPCSLIRQYDFSSHL